MITAVTSPDVVLELRPPVLTQVSYAASLVVAGVMIVVFVREIADDSAFSFVFPVFLAGILAFNTATVLSRARAHADGSLVVRNRFSTRQLPGLRRRLEGQAEQLRAWVSGTTLRT
jgi:hypothetical protein